MGASSKIDRDEAFCRAYVAHPVGVEASIAAGFQGQRDSHRTRAHKMLKRPEIRARIDELHKVATKKADFDAVWIRKKLKKLHDECEERKDEVKYRQLQAKCLTDMARMEALFIDKTEHSGQVAVEINVSTGIDRE